MVFNLFSLAASLFCMIVAMAFARVSGILEDPFANSSIVGLITAEAVQILLTIYWWFLVPLKKEVDARTRAYSIAVFAVGIMAIWRAYNGSETVIVAIWAIATLLIVSGIGKVILIKAPVWIPYYAHGWHASVVKENVELLHVNSTKAELLIWIFRNPHTGSYFWLWMPEGSTVPTSYKVDKMLEKRIFKLGTKNRVLDLSYLVDTFLRLYGTNGKIFDQMTVDRSFASWAELNRYTKGKYGLGFRDEKLLEHRASVEDSLPSFTPGVDWGIYLGDTPVSIHMLLD